MSDGIGLSGYATLTRPTMLMLQAGLDNKAAGVVALLPKPPQPRGDRLPWEIGPLPDEAASPSAHSLDRSV